MILGHTTGPFYNMSCKEKTFSLHMKTVESDHFNWIVSRNVFHLMFAYTGERTKNQPGS